MKQYTAWCAALMLALVPLTAGATAVLRSGETVTIEAEREVRGNFYGSGGTVTISGPVEGDAYLLGGSVVVNAPIEEDLVVLGGEVQVHGEIGEDVRIIAGDVTIDGNVGGDVVVLSGALRILSTATLSGDLLVYGGDVTIDGSVAGAVYGGADRMIIRSSISGPVELSRVNHLTLGEGARLGDTLTYSSPLEYEAAAGAEVSGEVAYTKTAAAGIDWTRYVEAFAALFVLGAVFFFFMRSQLPTLLLRTRDHILRNALIGTAVLIAVPIVAILLVATVVAAPLGLFLLFMYPVLIISGFAYLIVFVGAYAHELFTQKKRRLGLVSVLIGALIIWALLYVPFLVFVALLVPLGALVHELYALLVRSNKK